MKLQCTLYKILDDLSKHKLSKDEVIASAVKERLDKSLCTYAASVTQSAQYLSTKDTIRVLKTMNR